MREKILIGINPKNHTLLALDELEGLKTLGFECRSIKYGSNDLTFGIIKRLFNVASNAVRIIYVLYKFSPSILYLNSRFEPVATLRDFISLLVIKCFYYKKIKIIIKSHGSDPSILYKKFFFYENVIMPFMAKYVDAWFFLSSEEKSIIRKYNPVMANKVFTTCNIVDSSRSIHSVEFQKKHGLDNGKFNILYVGRIIKEKGIFEILRSIPLVSCKEKCDFIFVGEGPDLQKLHELIIQMNLSNHARILGFFNEEECDHFYANADILVFPTFFNEGFPMALFKSIAAGLPVITTKTRAAIDHLSTPNNVLWVSAKSEKEIANAIEELVMNEHLRETMSYNNKLLGEKFTQYKVCNEMSKVFLSV